MTTLTLITLAVLAALVAALAHKVLQLRDQRDALTARLVIAAQLAEAFCKVRNARELKAGRDALYEAFEANRRLAQELSGVPTLKLEPTDPRVLNWPQFKAGPMRTVEIGLAGANLGHVTDDEAQAMSWNGAPSNVVKLRD